MLDYFDSRFERIFEENKGKIREILSEYGIGDCDDIDLQRAIADVSYLFAMAINNGDEDNEVLYDSF